MSILRNVRAFIGLGEDFDGTDSYRFEIDEDHTDVGYSKSDDLSEELVVRPERDESRSRSESFVDLVKAEQQPKARQPVVEDMEAPVRTRTRPDDNATPGPKTRPNKRRARPSQRRPADCRPEVLTPASFDDAKNIADTYKSDTPVVINLRGVDRSLACRLIDFASGLCYVSGGRMEKIRSRVFLITPETIELSPEDRRLLAGRRYAYE